MRCRRGLGVAVAVLGLLATAGCGDETGSQGVVPLIPAEAAPRAAASPSTAAPREISTPGVAPTSGAVGDPLPADLAGRWPVDEDGAIVRIVDFGGSGFGNERGMLSLSLDGTVVVVGRTDVLATPADYTTFAVDRVGLLEALEALDRAGLHDPARDGGSGQVTAAGAVSFFFADGTVTGTADGLDGAEAIQLVVSRLFEPDTYGEHLRSGPEPWVPDRLSLDLRPEDRANPYDLAPWPFEDTVEELGTPDPSAPRDGEVDICLTGEDAALLWAGLERIGPYRFDDGTAVWAGSPSPSTPLYTVYGSGCAS